MIIFMTLRYLFIFKIRTEKHGTKCPYYFLWKGAVTKNILLRFLGDLHVDQIRQLQHTRSDIHSLYYYLVPTLSTSSNYTKVLMCYIKADIVLKLI